MLGIEENLDIGVRLFAFRFKNQVAEVFPESPDSQAKRSFTVFFTGNSIFTMVLLPTAFPKVRKALTAPPQRDFPRVMI